MVIFFFVVMVVLVFVVVLVVVMFFVGFLCCVVVDEFFKYMLDGVSCFKNWDISSMWFCGVVCGSVVIFWVFSCA